MNYGTLDAIWLQVMVFLVSSFLIADHCHAAHEGRYGGRSSGWLRTNLNHIGVVSALNNTQHTGAFAFRCHRNAAGI